MTKNLSPAASIVLRTWNGLDYIKLAYNSLVENTSEVDYELIIVDDNSNQETRDYLQSINPNILIFNNQKCGAPGTTSQGVSVARGKYVAILDSDVIVSAQWLSRLIKELETNNGHLISASRYKNLIHPDFNEPLKTTWNKIKKQWGMQKSPGELFCIFSNGRSINEFAYTVMHTATVSTEQLLCPPDCVGSSCVVIDKDYVNSIGGVVDYDYFPYSGDDVDLCWRIGCSGGKVLRSGSVYIHHFEHGSIIDSKLDFHKSIIENNQRLFERWGSRLSEFIQEELKKGNSIDELKTNFWLIRLFLDYKTQFKGEN